MKMAKKLINKVNLTLKPLISVSIFVLISSWLSAQGLKFDSISYKLQYIEPQNEMLSSKTRGEQSLIISYSLESYLPPIGDQFSTPSCVGWATSYYGFTIVNRIERGMQEEPFSPWSPYNRYQHRKNNHSFCQEGCYIEGVLNILKAEGSPTLKSYPFKSCAIDSSFKIYDQKLFDWMRISVAQNQIKSALQNNCPVVIGLDVAAGDNGNYNLRNKFIDTNGVLQMNLFQNNSYNGGGHALCIVAFNDTLCGGAFKIANSWGQDWGKKGFCWLKYSDLHYIHSAYLLRSNNLMYDENSQFITKGLEWINTSDSTIYLSYAYVKANGMINRGWFQILSQEKLFIPISDRTENKIYWTTLSEKGRALNTMHLNNGRNLICDTEKGFLIENNLFSLGKDSLYYNVVNPQNQFESETITLGMNQSYAIENLTEGTNFNIEELNLQWDRSYPLIDPYSSQIIINSKDKRKKYTIYYLENSTIKTVTGNINKISSVKKLKFLNVNNLENYHQLKLD
jgi:hypothetical protein